MGNQLNMAAGKRNLPMVWKTMILATFAVTSTVLILMLFSIGSGKSRFAYVRNMALLSEYKGMLDGKQQYDQQVSAWSANVDSLKMQYNRAIAEFNESAGKLSATEKKAKEELLMIKRQQAMEYESTVGAMAREAEEELMTGILKQIDAYLIEYGKESGYDYIFGVTSEGNILYANEADDVTVEVLKAINARYEGK